MEFYRCKNCGNMIAFTHKSGVPVICCGEQMKVVSENTVDAAVEKHVPVVERKGMTITVTVGSVAHPMVAEHYIEWIALQSKAGNQRKVLQPGSEPRAEFYIAEDDEVIKAYAYCNLHGLWSVSL